MALEEYKVTEQKKKVMLLGNSVHSVGCWVGWLKAISAPLQNETALKQIVKSLEVGQMSKTNHKPPDQM